MKRNIMVSGLVALATIAQLNAADVQVDKSKLDAIKSMSKVLQDPTLTLSGAIDKDSVYLLKLEAKSANGSRNLTGFFDKKTHALYIGAGYDKDGKMISFPKDAAVVNNGVSFTHGTGDEEIYIVTDPECPYCAKFEKAFGDKLENYTVHTILFPLQFHKKSPAMVEWIMQGKDDNEKYNRYRKVLIDGSKEYATLIKDPKKPFHYSPEVQKAMEKANKATIELNAKGTPMVFNSAFEQLSPSKLKVKQIEPKTN